MGLRCCLLHLVKQNCLLTNDDGSGISLPAFPSRTNLKMNSILITPKLVKKVITNFNSLKTSGPEYIPVVDLKKCDAELSCILFS